MIKKRRTRLPSSELKIHVFFRYFILSFRRGPSDNDESVEFWHACPLILQTTTQKDKKYRNMSSPVEYGYEYPSITSPEAEDEVNDNFENIAKTSVEEAEAKTGTSSPSGRPQVKRGDSEPPRKRSSRSPVYPFSQKHLDSHEMFASSGQYSIQDFHQHLNVNLLPATAKTSDPPALETSISEPLPGTAGSPQEEFKASIYPTVGGGGENRKNSEDLRQEFIIVNSKNEDATSTMLLKKMELTSPPVIQGINSIDTPQTLNSPFNPVSPIELAKSDSEEFASVSSEEQVPAFNDKHTSEFP
jgi:hypothetical protein